MARADAGYDRPVSAGLQQGERVDRDGHGGIAAGRVVHRTATDTLRPVTVMLVDECELVVAGMEAMLAPYDDLAFMPAHGRSPGAPPDVVLVDPRDLPWETAPASWFPVGSSPSDVVVYTWNPSPELVETSLRLGARGCLSKSLPAGDLAAALRRIREGHVVVDDGNPSRSRGRPPGEELVAMTTRELEVIGLVAVGLSNPEIAEQLTLSVNSIKSYIRSAYRKIGVASRSQAVLWGLRHGCSAPVGPGWCPPAEPTRDRSGRP